MGGWDGSRPPISSHFKGKVAEVWSDGTQVGLLYDWTLEGGDGKWKAESAKHRFTTDARRVEVRFFLSGSGLEFELRGEGHIIGEIAADGVAHRLPLKLKGTALAVV